MPDFHDDWCEYLDRMGTEGEWADASVILGMARMLERDILIVTSSPNGTSESDMSWVVGKMNYSGIPILLGHEWEKHYISLGKNRLNE